MLPKSDVPPAGFPKRDMFGQGDVDRRKGIAEVVRRAGGFEKRRAEKCSEEMGAALWGSWRGKQSSVKSCSVVVRVSQSASGEHSLGRKGGKAAGRSLGRGWCSKKVRTERVCGLGVATVGKLIQAHLPSRCAGADAGAEADANAVASTKKSKLLLLRLSGSV